MYPLPIDTNVQYKKRGRQYWSLPDLQKVGITEWPKILVNDVP
jgi:hypothetical protein